MTALTASHPSLTPSAEAPFPNKAVSLGSKLYAAACLSGRCKLDPSARPVALPSSRNLQQASWSPAPRLSQSSLNFH